MFISQNKSFHNSSEDDSTYFSGALLNPSSFLENTGTFIPRSQQDSGIDADNSSDSSVVLNDYLQLLGVQPNTLKLTNSKIELKIKANKKTDLELNELMYAKVDEIVGPSPLYRESDLLAKNSTFYHLPSSNVSFYDFNDFNKLFSVPLRN